MTRSRVRAAATRRIAAGLVVTVFALLTVAATASNARDQAGPTYEKAGSWGKPGTGNGQFTSNAFGLATDRAGNVYVADSDNHRIQVFSSRGAFKRVHPFAQSETVQDVATGPDGSAWGTALQGAEVRQFGGSGATITTPKSAIGVAVDGEGNVYVTTAGDNVASLVRYEKAASGYTAVKTVGGFKSPADVEVSPDGSVYVTDGLTVKRFVADRLVKTIKGGASAPLGIGVDLDCNLWMTNIAQRNLTRVSPTGKVLGTVTSGDLIAQDVAVGPTGDVYAFDSGSRTIVRFAEDRAKPATAGVGGSVTAANGVAKVRYTLSGVACPAQVTAVASLSGAVTGKATVKVPAGKPTVLSIPVKGSSGKARFRIVLRTNGRPTTQTAAVSVTVR